MLHQHAFEDHCAWLRRMRHTAYEYGLSAWIASGGVPLVHRQLALNPEPVPLGEAALLIQRAWRTQSARKNGSL